MARSSLDYQALATGKAAELGVPIHYDMPDGGELREDGVHCRHVVDQFSALILLHELGHHVLHGSMLAGVSAGDIAWKDIPNVVDLEADAWVWAREQLGEPITEASKKEIARCIRTYIDYARHA